MWVSKNCTGGSPQFVAPQRTVGRKETQSREIPKPHCQICNAPGIGKQGTEHCRAAGNYYERPSFSGSNWWKLGVTKVKPKETTKGQKYPSQKARLCWTDPKHEDVGAGSLLGCRGDTFPPAGVLGRAGWAWGDPAHGATILIPKHWCQCPQSCHCRDCRIQTSSAPVATCKCPGHCPQGWQWQWIGSGLDSAPLTPQTPETGAVESQHIHHLLPKLLPLSCLVFLLIQHTQGRVKT